MRMKKEEIDFSKVQKDKYSGQTYNKLTIVGTYGRDEKSGKLLYVAECDCGDYLVSLLYPIRSGRTKSCGCIQRLIKGVNIKKHIHYNRARHILGRCNDPTHQQYHNYGGRGIKCLLGNNTTEVCMSLDKVEGYFEGAQLDRIDNDGNYELGNLRWATAYEQVHNRVRKVEYDESLEKWVPLSGVTIESLATKPRYLRDILQCLEGKGWNVGDFSLQPVWRNNENRYFFTAEHKSLFIKRHMQDLSSTTIQPIQMVSNKPRKRL